MVHRFEKSQLFFKAKTFFPIFDRLTSHLKSRKSLDGLCLGWNCHLTAITAVAVKTLCDSGCRVVMSECNPDTSDHESMDYMRSIGAVIFTESDKYQRVLDEAPDVISDTGLDLLTVLFKELGAGEHAALQETRHARLQRTKDSELQETKVAKLQGTRHSKLQGTKQSRVKATKHANLRGASEITTSGITRLRQIENVPIPVINVNSGQIKSQIENFHGVGEGVRESLYKLTGRTGSALKVAVIGYGSVGTGIAHYLSRDGAVVRVVDADPVRGLVAHYNGFAITTIADAMREADVVITASGQKNLLDKKLWSSARDGLVVVNAGHWSDEINLPALELVATSRKPAGDWLDEYTLPDPARRRGKRVLVACNGSPANVVMLSGSFEPTFLHLCTEILTIEYLVKNYQTLPRGESTVAPEVERTVADLALASLDIRSC